MKTVLSFAAITLFAMATVSLAASEKEEIIDKEKAVWQTVQDKKFDAFRKYLADDFRSVYREGINNTDKEVADVKKANLKSFSFSDANVVFPDKDTALLTYKVTTQGTQDGKEASGSYNAASVWHKQADGWRGIFHTEVKAE
jgi:ketosteroid isomerase-like protein